MIERNKRRNSCAHLLCSVLTFLAEFTGGFLDLGGKTVLQSRQHIHRHQRLEGKEDEITHSDKSVLWLKLLLAVLVIVHQTETCTGTTAEFGLETENDHSLLVSLVQRREFLAKFSSGQVGSGGVEDGEHELFPVEETVRDELGGSKCDGAVGVLKTMG